jgi:hypothetical protein
MIPDLAEVAVPMSDGSWVSTKVARTAEIIADYDPNLEVRWIPRDRRNPGDDAFQIVQHCPDGAARVVMSVATEAEFDERVLERLWAADNAREDVQARLEAHNAAIRAMELKKQVEAAEEARDVAASVFASPLNRYVHNGLRYDLPERPTAAAPTHIT